MTTFRFGDLGQLTAFRERHSFARLHGRRTGAVLDLDSCREGNKTREEILECEERVEFRRQVATWCCGCFVCGLLLAVIILAPLLPVATSTSAETFAYEGTQQIVRVAYGVKPAAMGGQATATTYESFFAVAFVACLILFAICICCLSFSWFWSPILQSTLGLCGFGLQECCACFGTRKGRRGVTGTAAAADEAGATEPAQAQTATPSRVRTTNAHARGGGGGGGGFSLPWALTCGYCCGMYQPVQRPPVRGPPPPRLRAEADDQDAEAGPFENGTETKALIVYQHLPLLRF